MDEEMTAQAGENEAAASEEVAEEVSPEVKALTDALAELNDKHLRLAAEYENFRRRAATERQAAYTDGLEGALTKLLPILDNLERAAMYRDAEKVAEGLGMIATAAAEAMTSLGVETFGEVGESFDPALHNAVMHIEDDARGEGEISAVHQKGYRKGERILRYAMVTVAN